MKPLVHTFLLALILTVGIFPNILLSQDKLSNWYIQEVFLLADLNQDKYLSEPEILQLRENFAYYQSPENFDITDKNKDNYLDYQEFRYRFGQALVHRQEVDGKELKILSENYPYFEDATYKYLKRHPDLTARLMNNLIWTREHPDLMKQIIADRSWLSKEPTLTEALGSNLIWLTENPDFAKKFYQSKNLTSLSDIWQSWGISHRNYLSQHKVEEGVQIDFPFWPSDTEEVPQTELMASAPSPGEQQRWVDSVLMKSISLEASLKKAATELQRRDSVGIALFKNQEVPPIPEDANALKSEVESLRTQVRKMRIEKRLARIEEDILLGKTIKQKKQIALLEKEQEFSEQEGILTLNSKRPLAEELERYEAELTERDQRIKDLNESITGLNQVNQNLSEERKDLTDVTERLRLESSRLDKEQDALIRDLAADDKEEIFLKKEQDLQQKILTLQQQNKELLAIQKDLSREKEEMEASITRIIESKQEDNQDLIAIEEQYKQQILALDIGLEKALSERETAVGVSRQVQADLASELQTTQNQLASIEEKVGGLENEKLALNQSLTRALSEQREEEVAAWSRERDSLANELTQSRQQIIAITAEQELMDKNLEAQQKYGLEAERVELAKIDALTQEKDSLIESLAQSNQQVVALISEQQFMAKDLQAKNRQSDQAGKAELAKMNLLEQERDAMAESLAQSNKQIVALLSEQELLTKNLAKVENGESAEQNWTETRLKERDSLFITLNTASLRIQKLEKELNDSESMLSEQNELLKAEKTIAVQAGIPAEYDALFLRVNELEYDNGRLKDELEATLAMSNEREEILGKRLKSSQKESKRMASQMRRFKRRKNGKNIGENGRVDNLAMELDEERARLKEMKEVNQALLAQLQANNNYLGHNISKRDQYKQELSRLKTNLSKSELKSDSLKTIIRYRPNFTGPGKDSLMAYQKKIYHLQKRIQLNQNSSQNQIVRLNLEIDSLETEVITLEEEKSSIAQVKKVEASRSQLSGDREKRLTQLEFQLQEKELTLKQKEKMIQDKLKEIEVKEKKYRDMRKWEEELHLLERKLKINPAYQEAKKDNQ